MKLLYIVFFTIMIADTLTKYLLVAKGASYKKTHFQEIFVKNNGFWAFGTYL